MKPREMINSLKKSGILAYVDGNVKREARKFIRSEMDCDVNGNGVVLACGDTWEEVAQRLTEKGLI